LSKIRKMPFSVFSRYCSTFKRYIWPRWYGSNWMFQLQTIFRENKMFCREFSVIDFQKIPVHSTSFRTFEASFFLRNKKELLFQSLRTLAKKTSFFTSTFLNVDVRNNQGVLNRYSPKQVVKSSYILQSDRSHPFNPLPPKANGSFSVMKEIIILREIVLKCKTELKTSNTYQL